MKHFTLTLFTFSLLLGSSGCTAPGTHAVAPKTQAAPILTEAKVLALAAKAAAENRTLTEFKTPVQAKFSMTNGQGRWTVRYKSKREQAEDVQLMGGDGFLVIVDDPSGRTTVMGGM